MEKKILSTLTKVKKYYPELANTSISLKIKNSKYLMCIRPSLNSFFKKRENRHYNLIITKDKYQKFLKNLSQEELEGWIGHELAHVLEYQNLPPLKLIGFVMGYLFNEKFRKKTERKTDIRGIKHGLGKKLKSSVKAAFSSKHLSHQYKTRLKNNYLSPREISKKIKKYFARY
jgi:hypothetical protein